MISDIEDMMQISIHALREEGDGVIVLTADGQLLFQSTPSARRATSAYHAGDAFRLISIHALREEGDSCKATGERADKISIHALREEGDSASPS